MLTRNKGFFSIDAMAGLALIAVLSVAVIGVVSKQNAGSLKLAESRRAMRHAERVLSELEFGQPIPQTTGMQATIESANSAESEVSSGKQWVRVEVKFDDHEVELFGLVPRSSLESNPPSTTRGAE